MGNYFLCTHCRQRTTAVKEQNQNITGFMEPTEDAYDALVNVIYGQSPSFNKPGELMYNEAFDTK